MINRVKNSRCLVGVNAVTRLLLWIFLDSINPHNGDPHLTNPALFPMGSSTSLMAYIDKLVIRHGQHYSAILLGKPAPIIWRTIGTSRGVAALDFIIN